MKRLGIGTFIFVAGWMAWSARSGRADDPQTVRQMTEAFRTGQCLNCHGDIHKEWQNSLHAFAWRDPTFKAVKANVSESATKCDHCHAPEPLFITGVGKMPKLRTGERDSGVNCLTCHIDADGVMHGPFGGNSPFHKTKADPDTFRGVDLCASCHGQPTAPEYDEVTEFKKGPGKMGMTCQTCHMPTKERQAATGDNINVPKRMMGQHTFFGGYNDTQVKSAATVEAKVENGNVTVNITNAAGHPIPGAPFRALIAVVNVTDANNKVVLNKQEVYFKPLNPTMAQDKRIKSGETRTLTYSLAAQKGTVKVQLIYTRPNPAAPLDNTKVQRVVMAETETKF